MITLWITFSRLGKIFITKRSCLSKNKPTAITSIYYLLTYTMHEYNNENPELISQRTWTDDLLQMRNRILERAPSFSDMPIKEQEAVVNMILRFEDEVNDIATKAWKIQDTQFALMEQLLEFRENNLSGLSEHFRLQNGARKIRDSLYKNS